MYIHTYFFLAFTYSKTQPVDSITGLKLRNVHDARILGYQLLQQGYPLAI